jgi:hypothetical protein
MLDAIKVASALAKKEAEPTEALKELARANSRSTTHMLRLPELNM